MLQTIDLPDTVRLRPGTRGGWTDCRGCWHPGIITITEGTRDRLMPEVCHCLKTSYRNHLSSEGQSYCQKTFGQFSLTCGKYIMWNLQEPSKLSLKSILESRPLNNTDNTDTQRFLVEWVFGWSLSKEGGNFSTKQNNI